VWRELAICCGLGAGLLPAQDVSLAETLRQPLVYLSMETPSADAADTWAGSLDLLQDPGLLSLLGLDISGGGDRATAGRDAIALLKKILDGGADRQSGARRVELALTGIYPRSTGSVPLMVFRAELTERAATGLRRLLGQAQLARPVRHIGHHQIYELAALSQPRPGSLIEVALVGRQLLVSNHRDGLAEALGEGSNASAAAVDAPLRRHLELRPGALVVYADLQRLQRRWVTTEAPWYLQCSGIGSAARVVCAIERQPAGLRTSLVLEHERSADGWLGLAESERADLMVQRVPHQGLGGVALAVSPRKVFEYQHGAGVLRPSERGLRAFESGFRRDDCGKLGLDLENQVLRRLGDATAVVVVAADGGGLDTVVALSTEGATAGRRIFNDCKRTLLPAKLAVLQTDSAQREQLVFGESTGRPFRMAVARDQLLLAFTGQGLEQLTGSPARHPRVRSREISLALKRLGIQRERVAGVFCLDLGGLGQAAESFLLGRHIGYLQRDRGVTRIEVWTTDN